MSQTFGDFDRRSPNIPDYTCPAIDDTIRQIDQAIEALSDLTAGKGSLETLRDANDSLRKVGIYWRETAKGLADRVDALTAELSDMTRERDDLRSEVRSLELERVA